MDQSELNTLKKNSYSDYNQPTDTCLLFILDFPELQCL